MKRVFKFLLGSFTPLQAPKCTFRYLSHFLKNECKKIVEKGISYKNYKDKNQIIFICVLLSNLSLPTYTFDDCFLVDRSHEHNQLSYQRARPSEIMIMVRMVDLFGSACGGSGVGGGGGNNDDNDNHDDYYDDDNENDNDFLDIIVSYHINVYI